MTFRHYLLIAISFLGFVGIIAYEKHQSEILDLQSPLVETCVHHRANQRVEVHSQ